MAYTTQDLEKVQELFIGYYGRPAAQGGLVYWANELNAAGGDPLAIIAQFADQSESIARWGVITEDNIGQVVDDIFMQLFGRHAAPSGITYYSTKFINGEITPEKIVLAVINGAGAADRAVLDNKVAWSMEFVNATDPGLDGVDVQATYKGEADQNIARAMLEAVDADTDFDAASVIDQIVNSDIPDPGDPLYLETAPSGQNFNLTAETAAGADVMRLTGDSAVRVDLTNPAAQIKGLDLNGDGIISLDGVENNQSEISAANGAADFEIMDAYARNPLNQMDVNHNYLGDIRFDGTSYVDMDGDGVASDGNIYLGGLGVDTVYTGVGNDFIAGGGVAAGRFVNQLIDGTWIMVDTLYDVPVGFGGAPADDLSSGRNADFFFAELSALDPTDGQNTNFDGGNTTDDSAAGLAEGLSGLNSQNNDWILVEASDDDEPVFIGLGAGGWLGTNNVGVGNLIDIESVDASGNLYGFIDDVDVMLGARAWDIRSTDPVAGEENYGFGSTAQLRIIGSDAANAVIGGYDNDYIAGGLGNDLLMGGNLGYLLANQNNPNILNITNDGMDVIFGGDPTAFAGIVPILDVSADNIVFEADGGQYDGGGHIDNNDGDVDTLWLNQYAFGAADVADVTEDGVLRMDLLAGRVNGINNAAGYGGADQGGTVTGFTADQTNYDTDNTDGDPAYQFAVVQDFENVNATGLGAVDFLAAGTNDPELNFNNQQNFWGLDADLDLRGTNADNGLFANTGNDVIEGRRGDDSLMGGEGSDDFYFSLQPGDDVDVIHRMMDVDGDNFWDGVQDEVNDIDGTDFTAADSWSNDFLDTGEPAFINSKLTLTFVNNDDPASELADFPINGIVFSLDGVTYTVDSDAMGTAGTYVDFTAALNAELDAMPDIANLNAVLNADNSITITDPDGDTFVSLGVTWVDGITPASGNLLWNLIVGGPEVTEVDEDRLIFKAYEDRNDNEGRDDDSYEGSRISLGVDAYAEDLVVHFARGEYDVDGDGVIDIDSAGTRIAEEQSYDIQFLNVTTEDIVTIKVNDIEYKLQVGVALDGTIQADEDGVGEDQDTIQLNFLTRMTNFINNFMDDDTAAGSVFAAFDNVDTITLTQNVYHGEETVFMVQPIVDIENLSGGEGATWTVVNNADSEIHLLDFIGDDNKLNSGNVLFWGEQEVSRSVLETAANTGGALNGSEAIVINGGVDDLVNAPYNKATSGALDDNFAVGGDDLLIGGIGVDNISGGTGDDRILGSIQNDTLDGGKDWYFVQAVGEEKGTAVVLNAYEAMLEDADPTNIAVDLIRQTEDNLAIDAGADFVPYFDDTLLFQQADFNAGQTEFRITLSNFTGTGENIALPNGGAGTVQVDMTGNESFEYSSTFTNFENVRTVSGVGRAVADDGQGNDDLNISALSDAADVGVNYDLTNGPNAGQVSVTNDTDNDLTTVIDQTVMNIMVVDGVENVFTGNGDDTLLIDETEAAKDNRFEAGLGNDSITYVHDFGGVEFEPTLTITVESAANTDTVSMTSGLVGSTEAEDVLVDVETINLTGDTGQSDRADDVLDVTHVVDSVVDYVNNEVRANNDMINDADDELVTINNLYEIEIVNADYNDTVIVADANVMSQNANASTVDANLIINTWLNYDLLNDQAADAPVRMTLGDLRSVVDDGLVYPGADDTADEGDIPQADNFGLFQFNMGDNTDRVDYSNEQDNITAVFDLYSTDSTTYMMVDGNGNGVFTDLRDRTDILTGTEEIVASQGQSIIDLTGNLDDDGNFVDPNVIITYQAESDAVETNGRFEFSIMLEDAGNSTPFETINLIEYRDADPLVNPVVPGAYWNRIEGSDGNETVQFTSSQETVAHTLNLRGGDNEVFYNLQTNGVEVALTLLAQDLVTVEVQAKDSTGAFTGVRDRITSYTTLNPVSAGSLFIIGSTLDQDSIDLSAIVNGAAYILGRELDNLSLLDITYDTAGGQAKVTLAGFEQLRDGGGDDVYIIEDLDLFFDTFKKGLVDTGGDSDTLKLLDGALGTIPAVPPFDPAIVWNDKSIELDTFEAAVVVGAGAFDFDALDISELTKDTDYVVTLDAGEKLILGDLDNFGNQLDAQVDVQGFATIAFTEALEGDTFMINMTTGEFKDDNGDVLFTFDAATTFDFSLITDRDLTITEVSGADPTVIGGSGDDTITLGAAADFITGGPGADVMDGGFTAPVAEIQQLTITGPALVDGFINLTLNGNVETIAVEAGMTATAIAAAIAAHDFTAVWTGNDADATVTSAGGVVSFEWPALTNPTGLIAATEVDPAIASGLVIGGSVEVTAGVDGVGEYQQVLITNDTASPTETIGGWVTIGAPDAGFAVIPVSVGDSLTDVTLNILNANYTPWGIEPETVSANFIGFVDYFFSAADGNIGQIAIILDNSTDFAFATATITEGVNAVAEVQTIALTGAVDAGAAGTLTFTLGGIDVNVGYTAGQTNDQVGAAVAAANFSAWAEDPVVNYNAGTDTLTFTFTAADGVVNAITVADTEAADADVDGVTVAVAQTQAPAVAVDGVDTFIYNDPAEEGGAQDSTPAAPDQIENFFNDRIDFSGIAAIAASAQNGISALGAFMAEGAAFAGGRDIAVFFDGDDTWVYADADDSGEFEADSDILIQLMGVDTTGTDTFIGDIYTV